MRLLHKAVNGNNNATKLNFSVNPTITVNTTNYPSLMGWVFDNGTNKELFILNISNINYALDLSNIFNGNYSYEQISASNPLQKNITTQDLLINKGISNTSFQSLSYSLLYASSEIAYEIDDIYSDNNFLIFPNPSNKMVLIKQLNNKIIANKYQLIDINGSLIKTDNCNFFNRQFSIDLTGISSKMILLKLFDNEKVVKSLKLMINAE